MCEGQKKKNKVSNEQINKVHKNAMLTQGYDSYLWNPVHRIIRKKISPPLYMISSQLYQKENNIFLNLIITIKLMLGSFPYRKQTEKFNETVTSLTPPKLEVYFFKISLI